MEGTPIIPAEIIRQVNEKAAQLRAEDAAGRAKATAYGERVKPHTRATAALFSTLYSGARVDTGQPLAPHEALPMLRKYVDAKIEEARARLAGPYDQQDAEEGQRNLRDFTQIRETGNEGLANFCGTIISQLPRNRDTGEIPDRFKSVAERWKTYQELASQAIDK